MIFGASSAPGLAFFIVYGLDPCEEYIQHYTIREGRSMDAQTRFAPASIGHDDVPAIAPRATIAELHSRIL